MAKDWKQVAMALKREIRVLKAVVREREAWDKRQQRMYARLEKRASVHNQLSKELIVKECVKVCLDQRNPGNLNYKPSEMFADALKLHFGVSDE
jgi:hypothetical protein